MSNHDDSCEAQGPGESCCCVYRTEIALLHEQLTNRGRLLADRLREIKRLREAKQRLALQPFIGAYKEAARLKAEIETLRGLLREIVDQTRLVDMHHWENDLYMRVRKALGEGT